MHLYEEISYFRPNEIVLLHAWAVRLSFLGTVIYSSVTTRGATRIGMGTVIYYNLF